MKRVFQRKKRKVFLFLIACNILLLFLIYSNLFVYPNTYIGGTDISGSTAGQVEKIVKRQEEQISKIQVKDRTYTYSSDQMGIVFDPNQAVTDAFSSNRKIFPLNLFLFIQSLTVPERIRPPLVFTEAFEQFILDTTFDFSETTDSVSVDPETKSLVVLENSQMYRFNGESLKTQLINQFGTGEKPIYPQLTKVKNENELQLADINQKLGFVFGSPIIVYLDLGGTVSAVELKEEDIRQAVEVLFDPNGTAVTINVQPESLNKILTKRTRESGFPIRDAVVTQNVLDDFTHLVNLRFGGTLVSAVVTKLDDGPNTNGKLAKKYIEVDISQQKMYLFKDGREFKQYKVSTGIDYPTPVGSFEILNKVGLGFSTIYNVWLPWWMGFSYSDELNAYFGIHEQPYTLTQDGVIVTADPRPIGTPSTGGCVALAPGAAREVYVFADVGTKVVIYQ